VEYDGGGVSLDYSDDGGGFNPSVAGSSGMGLANISSRVNSLGGRFEIESSRGAGMRARVRIDLGKRL
ncbi:MAG: sensor histidine kinase, partial [Alistipes sp.]|jgi:signal transduction histidine kinase|nr:sensor histidine kinase [Alistipes sp.]